MHLCCPQMHYILGKDAWMWMWMRALPSKGQERCLRATGNDTKASLMCWKHLAGLSVQDMEIKHLMHPTRVKPKASHFLTIWGALKHQGLQLWPLRVESLHQLVGVYRVSKVALWIGGGHSGQVFKFIGPAEKERKRECRDQSFSVT